MTKHSKEEVTHLDNTDGEKKRKKSEYAIQLMEKQKQIFLWNLEKQFRFKKASATKGVTGEVLLNVKLD
jgi:ribosomal protein S4